MLPLMKPVKEIIMEELERQALEQQILELEMEVEELEDKLFEMAKRRAT
jgi:hypothetical protein